MNAKEQKLYRLERKLIKQYFKGLQPRPVKLVKKLPWGAHGEAGEPHLVIKDLKRTQKEWEVPALDGAGLAMIHKFSAALGIRFLPQNCLD